MLGLSLKVKAIIAGVLLLAFVGTVGAMTYLIKKKNKEIIELNQSLIIKDTQINSLIVSNQIDTTVKDTQLRFATGIHVDIEQNEKVFEDIKTKTTAAYEAVNNPDQTAAQKEKSRILIDALWESYQTATAPTVNSASESSTNTNTTSVTKTTTISIEPNGSVSSTTVNSSSSLKLPNTTGIDVTGDKK